MKKAKRKKLEAAGWAVGSVKEFLGLSEADAALIEMKLALHPPPTTRETPSRTRQPIRLLQVLRVSFSSS